MADTVVSNSELFWLQTQNSFELEKFECDFNAEYFNENHACALKAVDGRNKFIGGHAELIQPIDDLKVSCIYCTRFEPYKMKIILLAIGCTCTPTANASNIVEKEANVLSQTD